MAQDTMIEAAVTGGLDVSDRYTYVCVLNFSGGGGDEGRVPATPGAARRRFRGHGAMRLGVGAGAASSLVTSPPSGSGAAASVAQRGRAWRSAGARPSARRDRGSWQGARPLRAARGRPGNDAVSRDGGAAAGPGRRGPDRAELRPHAGGPRALCQEPCGRIVSRTAT